MVQSVNGAFCFSISLSISFFVSLSFSFSDSLRMAPNHKTTPYRNPLYFRASSSDSTPLHVRFYDEKARQDFSENFYKCGIHLERHVILSDFSDTTISIIIYRQGWESLWKIPVSCPSVIIQEFYFNMHSLDYSIPHFITSVQGTYIVVTPKLISHVLHVPRDSHPDYPKCSRLRIVSKDELLSLFCETLSSWGDHQNTLCLGFVKGLRFLNIVITFVLHLLSHYNSITEPRALFLLSLIEDLTIEFPSHFILSLIDVNKATTTLISLYFLLLSRGSFAIPLSLIPSLPTSPSGVPSVRYS